MEEKAALGSCSKMKVPVFLQQLRWTITVFHAQPYSNITRCHKVLSPQFMWLFRRSYILKGGWQFGQWVPELSSTTAHLVQVQSASPTRGILYIHTDIERITEQSLFQSSIHLLSVATLQGRHCPPTSIVPWMKILHQNSVKRAASTL